MLITQYLAGQGLINLVNIVVGLILLRVLPIEEFALYTIAIALQQVAAMGSDMGLSHAINTMGARIREGRYLLGSLYAGACFYGYRLYAVAACIVTILFVLIQSSHAWSRANVISVLFLILLTAVLQVTINFRKSILNLNHDAKALFYVGMAQAGVKLLFVPLCLFWPYASIAFLGNLVGTYACKWVIERQCRSRLEEKQLAIESQKDGLKKFIIPLMPVVVYHTLQGQISIFLLGYFGYTASIAELGALGRLGQLIGLLMLLNGFFIQPVFSRINQRNEFIKKGAIILLFLIVFSIISMLTVHWLPEWWLYIIGKNYSNLGTELPITVLTALLSLIGSTLYVVVISRNTTDGQPWYIVIGLSMQLAFLAIRGVHSTYDALLLSLIPVLSYACLQMVILVRILIKWERSQL